MLPKKNRLSRKDVDLLFKEGKSAVSPSLTFKYLVKKLPVPKISVIAPKAVSRLAVKRNLLRRRGYRALEKYINEIPSLLGVFIFKKYQDDVSILENEIKNIFNKIN